MTSFEEVLLRLKQRLRVQTDKEVAAMLGMADKAFNARKKRGAFPDDKLFALSAKRPDLQLDVTYVLTGRNSTFEERIRSLTEATRKATSFAIPERDQIFVRDLLFAIDQNDPTAVLQIIGGLRGLDDAKKGSGPAKAEPKLNEPKSKLRRKSQ